jgi:hypothetical protein
MKHYLDNNIFLINDFLSQSECEGVLNDTWQNWQLEVKSRVSLIFDNEFDIRGGQRVRILSKGESTEPHSDQHEKSCKCGYCINNPESYFFYGMVLYLNDNFTGGKLKYLKKNIEYIPKSGNLICHPASSEYEHQVLEVKSGTRKFLSFFLEEKTLKGKNG